ncbi:MAG: hemolysin family protein [Anaerolineae bacterium]
MTILSEIGVLLALVLINGLLAMSELAILSARRERLEGRAEGGDEGARAALELAEEPTRFLSTVQIGITLVGIITGAFGGAALGLELAALLDAIPWLARYSEPLSFAIVVLLTTYLALVLGELAPKRLALANPERAAARIAPAMRFLSRLTGPAVRLLSASTDAVVRLLGVRPQDQPDLTEEDVRLLIRQAAREGVLAESEQAMVERVFRLDDRDIDLLMTPRTEMVSINIADPLEKVWRRMAESGHDHFPAYEGSPDDVIGMLAARRVWAALAQGGPVNLRDLLQPPLLIPETAVTLRALDLFRRAGQEAALVVDEYGSVQGIVTLNAVMASVLGKLVGLAPVQRRPDGSLLIDGLFPVDDLMALLEIEGLPCADTEDVNTAGGLMMALIDRLPAVGDRVDVCGWRFEVLAMDGNRVDRLSVSPGAKTEGEPGGMLRS